MGCRESISRQNNVNEKGKTAHPAVANATLLQPSDQGGDGGAGDRFPPTAGTGPHYTKVEKTAEGARTQGEDRTGQHPAAAATGRHHEQETAGQHLDPGTTQLPQPRVHLPDPSKDDRRDRNGPWPAPLVGANAGRDGLGLAPVGNTRRADSSVQCVQRAGLQAESGRAGRGPYAVGTAA
uniref:(northern house mosquito) hypothetical protein n=1 Tax=Culex pipiens TaxID=7175 RepID=A0A8D8H8V3_CULPI